MHNYLRRCTISAKPSMWRDYKSHSQTQLWGTWVGWAPDSWFRLRSLPCSLWEQVPCWAPCRHHGTCLGFSHPFSAPPPLMPSVSQKKIITHTHTNTHTHTHTQLIPPFLQTLPYSLLACAAAALQHVVPPDPLASSEKQVVSNPKTRKH